jgi:hypothetical protein
MMGVVDFGVFILRVAKSVVRPNMQTNQQLIRRLDANPKTQHRPG